ncbi:MAG TPA: hypothetical protein PK677_16755 [Acidiphilium sp.]|nr:hypothetical protein [Acidiphilium sp.]
MTGFRNLAVFIRYHKLPLVSLVLLALLANAVALSGFFNSDPTLQLADLGIGLKSGWVSGPPSWLDPSVGYITQPIGHLAASDWLRGIIPWWNPYSGIGMPLAAETQTEAFFLPFVLLLHFNTGWLVLRIILQGLCGIFAYILFVQIGMMRRAAFLGGALFMLSPEFFLSPSAPIAPLPFLPLLLLGIERAANATIQGRRMGWSLIVLSCAYSIYAGNPEVAYFDGLLAGVWALWRLCSLPRGMRIRFVGKLFLSLTIALGLCAPLLVPAFDYLRCAYIGPHSGYFRTIHMGRAIVPLQLFPFLYGLFGGPPPASIATAFSGPINFVRVPGWVNLPALTLALAALWRRGPLPATCVAAQPTPLGDDLGGALCGCQTGHVAAQSCARYRDRRQHAL